MFRLWGKIFKDNHMLRDTVVENDLPDTRTHKIFSALEEICYQFDLGKPIWLDANVNSDGIKRQGFHRIILWKPWSLITWKFM